jgi:AraC-like DNA-binding protein
MRTPILDQKYTSWGEAEFNAFVDLLKEDPPDSPPSADVQGVIGAFDQGLWSQDDVARLLGVSTATLRRRLTEAGHSFRDLSAEFRRTELQYLLATTMPADKIAERLGLSDDRSLRRFCAEQLGASPRAYRRLQASQRAVRPQ